MKINNHFKRITKFSGLIAGLTLSPAAKVAAMSIPLTTVAIVTATLVGSPVPVDRTPATPVIASTSLDTINLHTDLPVLHEAADVGSDNTSALIAMADQKLSAFDEEVVQPDALPITTSSAPSRRFAKVVPQLNYGGSPVTDIPPCVGTDCKPPENTGCVGTDCKPSENTGCVGTDCKPSENTGCVGTDCKPSENTGCVGTDCKPSENTGCVGADCKPSENTGCVGADCKPPENTGCVGADCKPSENTGCVGTDCKPPENKGCVGDGCNFPEDTVCVGAECNQPLDTDCLDGSCVIPTRTALPAVAAVPEPETLALLGVGLLGMGWFRRKR